MIPAGFIRTARQSWCVVEKVRATMGQGDATTIRCLVLEPGDNQVAWFTSVAKEAGVIYPKARVKIDDVSHLSGAKKRLKEQAVEGDPYALLLTSREQLQKIDSGSFTEIHALIDAHPRLSVVVIGKSAKASDKLDNDVSISSQLPGRVVFLRDPVCSVELTQVLRMQFERCITDDALKMPVRHADDQMPVPDNAKVLLQALLESLPDAVYFKDLESRFIAVSNIQAKSFGVEPWELVGKSDADVQDQGIAERARAEELEILRSGRAMTGLCERITLASGAKKWVMTNKAPLRDNDGHLIGTFGVSTDVSGLKQAEEELKEMHKRLLDVSRQAGMAEVATGVLHNVGNVLNSVTTCVSTLRDSLEGSRVNDLSEAAALLRDHRSDLSSYLSGERGEQFFAFIDALSGRLQDESSTQRKELQAIDGHVQHICQIVSMQQNYAKVLGVQERVRLSELVEQAVMINAAGLERHGVKLVVESQDDPEVFIERHKVLQILVNLISNAKYACDRKTEGERRITVQIKNQASVAVVAVVDTGIGIRAEHMKKLFTHGFTTKKDGHGFGLHNSVLAAQEMGGDLSAMSEGEGMGACFSLELPLTQIMEAA